MKLCVLWCQALVLDRLGQHTVEKYQCKKNENGSCTKNENSSVLEQRMFPMP